MIRYQQGGILNLKFWNVATDLLNSTLACWSLILSWVHKCTLIEFFIVYKYFARSFSRHCTLIQGHHYSKHACREHYTYLSCTHVEESNPSTRHDKFRPSDFPGREHQLNQAGSISISGLPKWCSCHRVSMMGLKITSADPGALMWPCTLWRVWFYVSPMKPIKLQMQMQPDPLSKLFRLADTVYKGSN